uniref:Uncharacterized protein n=1 Tax=Anguilla anguilla TaxID=7936 RepID=A0A0E9U2Y4_ANGAN
MTMKVLKITNQSIHSHSITVFCRKTYYCTERTSTYFVASNQYANMLLVRPGMVVFMINIHKVSY